MRGRLQERSLRIWGWELGAAGWGLGAEAGAWELGPNAGAQELGAGAWELGAGAISIEVTEVSLPAVGVNLGTCRWQSHHSGPLGFQELGPGPGSKSGGLICGPKTDFQ